MGAFAIVMIRCCPGDLTHDVRHLTGAQITDQFRAGVEQATARAVADNARRQVELDVVTAELAHRQALPAPVAAAADTARRRADAARRVVAPSRGHDPRYDHSPRHDYGPTRRGPGLGR